MIEVFEEFGRPLRARANRATIPYSLTGYPVAPHEDRCVEQRLAKGAEFQELCRELDILLAYFHGSRARGRQRLDSDYDYAVLLNDRREWSDWERVEQLDRFGETLSRILQVSRDEVDIQDLSDMPIAIALNVITHGVCLWEGEKGIDVLFRRQTMSRYQDFQPIETFFRKAVRRRLLERAAHG